MDMDTDLAGDPNLVITSKNQNLFTKKLSGWKSTCAVFVG